MTYLTLYDVNSKFSNILVELRSQNSTTTKKWLTTDFHFINKWGKGWRYLSYVLTLGLNYPLSHVKVVKVAESLYQQCEAYSQKRLLTSEARQNVLFILDELNTQSNLHHSKDIENTKRKIEKLALQPHEIRVAEEKFEALALGLDNSAVRLCNSLELVPKKSLWHERIAKIVTFIVPFYDYFYKVRTCNVIQNLFNECLFLSKQHLFSESCKENALKVLFKLNTRTNEKWKATIDTFHQKINSLKTLFEKPDTFTVKYANLAEQLETDRNKWITVDLTLTSRWSFAAYYYQPNDAYDYVDVHNVARTILSQCRAYASRDTLSKDNKKQALRIIAALVSRKGSTAILKNVEVHLSALNVNDDEDEIRLGKGSNSNNNPREEDQPPAVSRPAPPNPPLPPPPPAPKVIKKEESKFIIKDQPRKTVRKTWWGELSEFKTVRAKFANIKKAIDNIKPTSHQCLLECLNYSGYTSPIKNHFIAWLLEGASFLSNLEFTLLEIIKQKLIEQINVLTDIGEVPLRVFWFEHPYKSLNDFIIEEVEKSYSKKFNSLLLEELKRVVPFTTDTISKLWFEKEKNLDDILRKARKSSQALYLSIKNELIREMLVEKSAESLRLEVENVFTNPDFDKKLKENFGENYQEVLELLIALSLSQSVRDHLEFSYIAPSGFKETLELEKLIFANKEYDLAKLKETYQKYNIDNRIRQYFEEFVGQKNNLLNSRLESAKKNHVPEIAKIRNLLKERTGLSEEVIDTIWIEKEEVFERTKITTPIMEAQTLNALVENIDEIESEVYQIFANIFAEYPTLYNHLFANDIKSIEQTILILTLSKKTRNKFKAKLPKAPPLGTCQKSLQIKLFMDDEASRLIEWSDEEIEKLINKYKDNEHFKHIYINAIEAVKKYFEEKTRVVQESAKYKKDCEIQIKLIENEYKAKKLARSKRLLEYYLNISSACSEEILTKDLKQQVCALLSDYSPEHNTKLYMLKLEIVKKNFQNELNDVLQNVAERISMKSVNMIKEEERSIPLSKIFLDDKGDQTLNKFEVQGEWLKEVEKALFSTISDKLCGVEADENERLRYAKGLWYSLKGMKAEAIAVSLNITGKEAQKYMFY